MPKKPTYEELEQRTLDLEHSESELKLNFKRAQKISKIGSWDWDPHTDNVTYTDMIFEIFGINETDFGGNFSSMMAELVHPEDRAKVQEAADKAQATGVGSDVTYRIIRSDGEIRWIRAMGESIFEGGQLIKIIGTNQDVTEQKLAEYALKDSENKYRVLTESTSLGIGVSKGFEMIYANPAILDMFLIDSIDKFNEKPPLDYLTPESKKRVRERIEKLAQGEKVPDEFTIEFIRSDDEQRTLELYFADITLSGELCRLMTFNDTTERKRMEDEVRRLSQFQESIIDNANVWLNVLDENANVVVWNKAAEEISGYSREEVIGSNEVFLWSYPDETYRNEIIEESAAIIRGKKAIEFETTITCKDGSNKAISWYSNNILDDKEKVIGSVAMGVDVTNRKKAEEQVKASLKEKETMLQEIHHRVKNNMQVIVSLLRIQSRKNKSKKFAVILKESQDRIKSMALVHENLYQSGDLSKIDIGGYTKNLIDELFRSHGVSRDKIGVKLEIEEIPFQLDIAIPFGLIINELISNSLKYAFPGNKKGEIKLTLRSSSADEIELIVQDNGMGISEELDFRNTESLGLELVIILAEEQLDGRIVLDRSNGSTFTIQFNI